MIRLSQVKQCVRGQGGRRCNCLLTGSASLLLGLHRVVVHEGRLNEHQGRGQCHDRRWTSFLVTALFSLLPECFYCHCNCNSNAGLIYYQLPFVTLHVCSISPLATVTTTLTLNITARVEIHLDEVLARAEAPHRWWRIDQLVLKIVVKYLGVFLAKCLTGLTLTCIKAATPVERLDWPAPATPGRLSPSLPLSSL